MLALVVDTSAHPRAMCYKCYNESISLTTRLTLNEFQASCYSHHRSQSALSETNWLLRVSRCNPYLESLPTYIDGVAPWTPTNRGHGITSRPLKHDLEIPPRDFQGITHWHGPSILDQSIKIIAHLYIPHLPSLENSPIFIFLSGSILNHFSPTIVIGFQIMPIPCHFNTNHLI